MKKVIIEKLSKQDLSKMSINLFFFSKNTIFSNSPKVYSSQKRAQSKFHNTLDYKVNRFNKAVSSILSSKQIQKLINK